MFTSFDYKNLNKFIENIIVECINEAKKSNVRFKHGCIIIKGRKIISKAYNKYSYNPTKRRATIHAEEAAILKCNKKDMCNADLYVIRYNENCISNHYYITNSKPCKCCEQKILSCIKK